MLVGFLELCSQDSEEDLESFAYHKNIGIFLAVQWLRLCASTEGCPLQSLAWGAKLSHDTWCSQKKKKKKKLKNIVLCNLTDIRI